MSLFCKTLRENCRKDTVKGRAYRQAGANHSIGSSTALNAHITTGYAPLMRVLWSLVSYLVHCAASCPHPGG